LVSVLVLLGLVLVALGTGALAATFRSGKSLVPGTATLLHRLSPLAKGSFLLLGVALAVVGLVNLLSPERPLLSCLVFLALGITTGLGTVCFASVPGTRDAPGPWSISSHGWVSLAFLGLAGGVLATHEARLVGLLGSMAASTANRSATAVRGPAGPVTDEPSNWSMRKYQSAQTDPMDPATERARLERQVTSLRKQLAAYESGTRSDRSTQKAAPAQQPAGTPSVVDLSQWNHKVDSPGPAHGADSEIDKLKREIKRLDSELADSRQRIVELEAARSLGRPQESRAAMTPASTVDLSKWSHPTP
jgi:hypothetical protein